ncbi:MAG: glycyl-radical enzyme activating protein, partial [candidate division Zixibacteria bacterium]
IHDGPGIRTTVFFKGCSLDCWWCHNPESRNPNPESRQVRFSRGAHGDSRMKDTTIGYSVTVEELIAEILKDRIFYDQSGGGVTISGGEPLMQVEFLSALLDQCHCLGIHTTVDTSGYAEWEAFEQIYDSVDLFLYDIKIMDENDHKKYVGVSNQRILSNLGRLTERGDKVNVRIPMVPDITDTRDNLEAIAAFLSDLPNIDRLSLLPYNKLGEDKVERFKMGHPRRRWQTMPTEQVRQAGRMLESHGYKVSIGG